MGGNPAGRAKSLSILLTRTESKSTSHYSPTHKTDSLEATLGSTLTELGVGSRRTTAVGFSGFP